MVAEPAVTPVTTPVEIPAVAMLVLALVHDPPDNALLKEIVELVQTAVGPEIAPGVGFTVSADEIRQPVDNVNVIAKEPAVTPVTTPLLAPTVARVVLLLLHVPLPEASVKLIVLPVQTTAGPEMAAGVGLTVNVIDVKQPPGAIYVILAVPADIPVTMPEGEPTVAIAVALLTHVPVPDELANVVLNPSQTDDDPVIDPGAAFTVIDFVTWQPVGSA